MKKFLILCFCLLLCGCSPEQGTAAPEGVVIALLDTGISTEALGETQILPGWNYVTGTDDTQDRINHGTAVASVILGCETAGVEPNAPQCRIVPLVVTDRDGSVSTETLARAIRDSIDLHGADIINLSLGIREDHPELREAIGYAEEMGVIVVSSVGNSGASGGVYYPAAYDTVIAVGSHDRDGKLSSFSQRNGTVDLLAPGEDIHLASRKGKTYVARGTSYATAYVSAAAANLLTEDPGLSPEKVRQSLFQSAVDIGPEGYDPDSGWGILNSRTDTASEPS